jgi:hypothetical protein
MSSDGARPSRATRIARVLLAQLVFLVVGLLLAEAGMRLWRRMRGDPYDSRAMGERIALMRSRASELVPMLRDPNESLTGDAVWHSQILHPYSGSLLLGTARMIELQQPRIGDKEADKDYEILLCGGSASAVFGRFGGERLTQLLEADPRLAGRKIFIYEYGVGGFKQPQTTGLVGYMFALGFTPECVIAIDGFNEVALGNGNAVAGANPTYPSVSHWGALTDRTAPDHETTRLAWEGLERQNAIVALANRALAWGAQHSVIAGTIVLGRLNTLEAEARASFEAFSARQTERSSRFVRGGPEFQPGAESAVALAVRAWKESSRSLRALCEARGIDYVHVLQPTLHDVGSKRLTQHEIDTGAADPSWIEGVHVGYPLLRAAGAELRAGGEHFIDATQLFADQPGDIYFDNCHYNRLGNYLLANHLAPEVLKTIKPATR